MRKLKLQVQMSVDGFIAGANGEMHWMTWHWDDELKDYVSMLTEPVDTILLGRKMAPGFITHWNAISENVKDVNYPFARKMIDTPKIVFTKTLHTSQWPNTIVANGDLVGEVHKLKNHHGGDMIVYGGATFDSSLIHEGLIDEYFLFINPAALGHGLPIFQSLHAMQKFELVESRGFECGITLLRYIPRATA